MVEKSRNAGAPQTLIKLPAAGAMATDPKSPDVGANATGAAAKAGDAAWTATGAVDPKKLASALVPVDVQAQAAAETRALKLLSPVGITGIDPLQALDGIKDGKVTLTLPLTPGEYSTGKANFVVKEGTQVHVEVEVKNGRLVASRDAKGKETGDGTKITIDPPIGGISIFDGKLKLPVKLDGLYMQDGKAKKGADPGELVKANISHFFDLKMADLKNPSLGDAVRTLSAMGPKNGTGATPSASKADKHKAGHGSLQDLVALDKVSFAGQVTMNSDAVDLGPAQIQLAPGSQLSVSGDAQHATLDAQLNIQSATFKHPQLNASLGSSSATMHAEYAAAPDGTMHLKTQLSGFNAQVSDLDVRQPGTSSTDGDHVHLTNTKLTNGQLLLDATLAPVPGSRIPQVQATSVSVKGHAEGFIDAKLTSPDPKNPAHVTVDASRFQGDVDVGPGGQGLEGTITGGAHLQDGGLQNGTATAKSLSADFEGTIQVHAHPDQKTFSMNVDAKKLQIALDGYRATTAGQTIDISHFDAGGPVSFSVDSSGAITADGNLGFNLQPNELKVGTPGRSIDLGHSTVSGTATHLRAGGGQPLELKASVAYDASINQLDLATDSLSVEGSGHLKGQADLSLGARGAGVVLKNTQAQLTTTSGHVGSATTPVGLDLTGGKASLNIKEARYGTAAPDGAPSVTLGQSKLEATVSNGHITVKGQPVALQNAHVEFDVDKASEKPGGSPLLKGHMTLTATVGTDAINNLGLAGVTIAKADAAKGVVTLKVPNVTLDGNGRLSVEGAQFSLDAQVGNIKKSSKGVTVPRTALAGSPAGVASKATVAASTPAQLAGVMDAKTAATAIDPLELVKNVKHGNVQLTIPFEGKVGAGWKSIDFPKGTNLKLNLVVENGALVPGKTNVEFIQPGRETIRGYIGPSAPSLTSDVKNDLRRLVGEKPIAAPVEYGLHIDVPVSRNVENVIAGTVVGANTVLRTNIPVPAVSTLDVEVPFLQHLPLNLKDFVNHLQTEGQAVTDQVQKVEKDLGGSQKAAPAKKGAPSGALAQLEAAIKVNQTQVEIDGTVGGTIPFPGGSIDLANDTNVKLKGTPTGAHLDAHVDINAMKVSTPELYLDGGKGGGDLSIDWQNGVAKIDLKNMHGILNKSAVKADNDSYVSLGPSQCNGTSVHVEVPLVAPNLADPNALNALRDSELGAAKQNLNAELSKARLDVAGLNGNVIGGRFSYPTDGSVMTTELSGALNGEFHYSGGQLSAQGRITDADLGLSGLKASTTVGSGEVGRARLRASGSFGVSSRGVVLDVTGQFAGQGSGKGRDGEASVNVTGSGSVVVNGSTLSISNGSVHIDGTGSAQTVLPTKPAARPATHVTIRRPVLVSDAH